MWFALDMGKKALEWMAGPLTDEKNAKRSVLGSVKLEHVNKISVGIADKYLELAVRALHKAFGLDSSPEEEPLDKAVVD